MKRILVTGANGYIGRHTVKALLDMGCEVIASDFSFDGVDERAERCDVAIFSGSENIYEELGKPDAVLHMAWRNGFRHNDDSHICDLPSHYMFIKNMLAGGLRQIAVMGSMHEVGYWEGAIDENTPCNPMSNYGVAKNALRQAVFALPEANQAKIQWLRAYYIVGDDLHNNSVFSRIVQLEKQKEKTFPFTSGKNLYDFINVDDLARQLASSVKQDEVIGIINCCTGNPVSLAERVEQFISENGFSIRPEYGAFPDRPYDSPGVWGNPEKINKIMGIE